MKGKGKGNHAGQQKFQPWIIPTGSCLENLRLADVEPSVKGIKGESSLAKGGYEVRKLGSPFVVTFELATAL